MLTPIYAVVPPVSTLMLWSALTFQGMERDWVPFDAIAPVMVNSVIMSEDGQFCEHSGVDWDALDAVLDREGGPSRGASTIPMQTVKNLFLWQSRSYIRKGAGDPPRLLRRFHPVEAADPDDLPEHRAMGPGPVRRRGRLAALFQQAGREADGHGRRRC